jgi:phage shock protein A
MSLSWLLVLLAVAAAVIVVLVLTRGRGAARDPLRPIDAYLDTLERQRAEAAVAVNRIVTAQKLIEEPLSLKRQEANTWLERARRALQAGDEDEARSYLRRQLEAESATQRLVAELDELAGTRRAVESQYAGLKTRLEEGHRRRQSLLARDAAASVGMQALEWEEQAARARSAFEELQSGVHSAEARAAAAAEVAAISSPGPNLPESEVESRLQALRAGRPG